MCKAVQRRATLPRNMDMNPRARVSTPAGETRGYANGNPAVF